MGMRLTVLAALAIAAAAPVALPAPAGARAVNGYSPALRNSAQRRAIVAALRPAVEAELGPVDMLFHRVRVRSGWALVWGDVIRRRNAPGAPAFDGQHITAVLRFDGRRWRLVRHAVGAADDWYCDPALGIPRETVQC